MPSPRQPSVIQIKADNVTDGHTVTVRNLTSGGKRSLTIDGSGNAVADLANFSEWAAGDVIVVERRGDYLATANHTLQSGRNPPKFTLSGTQDARPSISL